MNADTTSSNPGPEASIPPSRGRKELSIRIFGVGNAGCNVLRHLNTDPLPGVTCLGINTDGKALADSGLQQTVLLQDKALSILGTGGDPERGRSLAETQFSRLQSHCAGADLIFIVAGLGGGAGTGISPVLARAAKEAGALVLGFVVTPFACELCRRGAIAEEGLDQLREIADGVIILHNERVFQWIDENSKFEETFRTINEFIAEGLRGFWRMIVKPGLIEIHFSEIAALLRDRHNESVFAVAEAAGATRSRQVTDHLLKHPALENGNVLKEADAVLISLTGGPDLTMAEVNRVTQALSDQCNGAAVIMGAGVDEAFQERLAVTVIAARKTEPAQVEPLSHSAEQLDSQLLSCTPSARPNSRIVPPAPTLGPDQMKQLMESRPPGYPRKKGGSRFRQTQLPLEIISKGRFDKSEPTIHKGEDLDVPTYIRRGVSLN